MQNVILSKDITYHVLKYLDASCILSWKNLNKHTMYVLYRFYFPELYRYQEILSIHIDLFPKNTLIWNYFLDFGNKKWYKVWDKIDSNNEYRIQCRYWKKRALHTSHIGEFCLCLFRIIDLLMGFNCTSNMFLSWKR